MSDGEMYYGDLSMNPFFGAYSTKHILKNDAFNYIILYKVIHIFHIFTVVIIQTIPNTIIWEYEYTYLQTILKSRF